LSLTQWFSDGRQWASKPGFFTSLLEAMHQGSVIPQGRREARRGISEGEAERCGEFRL